MFKVEKKQALKNINLLKQKKDKLRREISDYNGRLKAIKKQAHDIIKKH